MDVLRGMTEDHTSSEDEVQKQTAATKAAVPKLPAITRPKAARDPHDLIRGITEDHSSDEDWKPKKSPALLSPRTRNGPGLRSKGPIGDPHGQLRAMTDDLWSDDDKPTKPALSPVTATRKPRGSSSGGKAGGKGSRDPHDLIRGMTEDLWSSDEEPAAPAVTRKTSSTTASMTLKTPLSETRPRLSSNSLRPDNTHDLIRGMTEDVWSTDEDKPQVSPRKSSTSSAKAAADSTLVVGTSPKKPPLVTTKSASGPPVKPAVLLSGPRSPTSPVSPTAPIRVLMVCLGNICRSPMAHGVMQYLTRPGYLPKGAPQIRVDSAGTGAYHALSPPDARTLELFKIHHIKGFVHKARRVRANDFWEVDYILCMDAENLHDLRQRRKTLMDKQGAEGAGKERREPKAKIQLFGEYGGNQTEIVEDPYYGSNEGFDVAWEQVVRMARGFLREVVGVEVDTRDLMGMV